MVYLIAFFIGGAVSIGVVWSIRSGVEKLGVIQEHKQREDASHGTEPLPSSPKLGVSPPGQFPLAAGGWSRVTPVLVTNDGDKSAYDVFVKVQATNPDITSEGIIAEVDHTPEPLHLTLGKVSVDVDTALLDWTDSSNRKSLLIRFFEVKPHATRRVMISGGSPEMSSDAKAVLLKYSDTPPELARQGDAIAVSFTGPESGTVTGVRMGMDGKQPQARQRNRAASSHTEPHLTFSAYLQPLDESYMEGTLLGGIVWEKRYFDTRLDVSNGAIAVKNLNFLIELDTSIAGVGQVSQFPGFIAFPSKTTPAAWLEGLDSKGNPVSVPIAPTLGMANTAQVYRVHCSDVFSDTVIHLVIASIAMNHPQNGRLPQQLFAERRPPGMIRIEGTYETEDGRTHPVQFSHEFEQP